MLPPLQALASSYPDVVESVLADAHSEYGFAVQLGAYTYGLLARSGRERHFGMRFPKPLSTPRTPWFGMVPLFSGAAAAAAAGGPAAPFGTVRSRLSSCLSTCFPLHSALVWVFSYYERMFVHRRFADLRLPQVRYVGQIGAEIEDTWDR